MHRRTKSFPPLLALALLAPSPGCNRHSTSGSPPSATPPSAGGPAPAEASRVDPALSRDGAAQLAAAFQREGSDARVIADTDVMADGHRLSVRVTVERVVDQGDHATAAIDVAMDLDGHATSALHTSAVGIDANPTEAVAHAVREWAVGYAMPIVAALRFQWAGVSGAPATDGGPAVFTLGPYRAFPGPTGVRGDTPDGWDAIGAELHRGLLERASGELGSLVADGGGATGLHSLKLALHVVDGAVRDGDCRVDGAPSTSLCQAARAYAWPAQGGDFLFKQFYVLVPGR